MQKRDILREVRRETRQEVTKERNLGFQAAIHALLAIKYFTYQLRNSDHPIAVFWQFRNPRLREAKREERGLSL